MRLICPNCGAQYEVADDVIPQDGRDVQCSSCAHTWFEDRGASEAREEAPAPVVVEPSAPVADEDAEWGEEDYAAKPASPPKAPIKRQALDPAIADILREEAAREAAARRAESQAAIQTQTELGLDSAGSATDQRAEETKRRVARLKSDTPEVPKPAPIAPIAQSRSDLLPDIEEINSSLRSSSERGIGTGYAELEDVAEQKQRGFRGGFFGMMFLLALLTLTYIFAQQINTAMPAIEGPVAAYVNTVDKGRLWLDRKMRAMLENMKRDDAEMTATPATE